MTDSQSEHMTRKTPRRTVPVRAVQLSDLDMARAIALAVCAVPGVLEMSPGRFALQATYGPGAHVTGVVLRRPFPDALVADVHVVVAESALLAAFDQVAARTSVTDVPAELPHLAERIREAIAQAISLLGLVPLATINVALDDIR